MFLTFIIAYGFNLINSSIVKFCLGICIKLFAEWRIIMLESEVLASRKKSFRFPAINGRSKKNSGLVIF